MRQIRTYTVIAVLPGMLNCPAALAATINVPFGQPTIQAGIDAAVSGADEVVVAPGTYNEIIDLKGKAITVRSSGGAAVTTIDATLAPDPGDGKPVVRCDNGETAATVLDGFTITGGTGDTAASAVPVGGGMFNNLSSATVANCIFTGNSAKNGSDMSNTNESSPTVINCTFSTNITADSGSQGGGMYNKDGSNPTVIDSTFIGNSSQDGGAMSIGYDSSPVVTNCTFSGNTASGGGGMSIYDGIPIVTNCLFSENTGGGMTIVEGSPIVTNCSFVDNEAGATGGGMLLNNSSPTVTNCTFSGNTTDENYGGGISVFNTSNPTITNSVLWGNSDAGGMNATAQIYVHSGGGTPVVNYSNVQGGWAGSGGNNINADPLFADAPNGDLRLSAGSPCINAGDNGVVTEPADLDGNNRISSLGCGFSAIVDMGAYEFEPSPGDQDGDGVTNASDNCPCYPNPTQEYNRADFDEDCDVDGIDFAVFASCYNKAGNPPRSLGCPQP